MKKDILYIDGQIIELGPHVTNNAGLTDWDYIKVEGANGQDTFLPKNKTTSRMSSYFREGLGRNVRLFYFLVAVPNGGEECSILGIEIDNGKRFSMAAELDAEIKKGGNLLNLLLVIKLAAGVFIIACLSTLILSPIALIFAWGLWKYRKGGETFKKALKLMPTSAEFRVFFESNSRSFQCDNVSK